MIYERSGWMSIEIVSDPKPAVPTVSSREAFVKASPADEEKAIDGFYAYYRTWSVDPSGSTVTHHIEQSLYPGVQSLLYGHHLRVGTRIDNEQPRTPRL